MSKTYIHIQKGKFNSYWRQYHQHSRTRTLAHWNRYHEADYNSLFNNQYSGPFQRYSQHCFRHNSEKGEFTNIRNWKKQKIAEKEFRNQLKEYYLYSQKFKL